MNQPLLIRQARVVSPRLAGAPAGSAVKDVFVESGKIARISEYIEVGDLDDSSVETIDAAGMLLMPGMVDTHNHMWESLFRGRNADGWGSDYYGRIPPMASFLSPEDAYIATLSAGVELLSRGVTTVRNYSHGIRSPEHADAEVIALRDTGIRGEFCYELHDRRPDYVSSLQHHEGRLADAERIAHTIASDELLTFGVGLTEFSPDNTELAEREIEFARDLGALISFHNNYAGEITALAEAGVLNSDVLPIHGNYNDRQDWKLLADAGGFLSFQPQTEILSGRRPMSMVAEANRYGVRLCLGADVPANANLGLLEEMRMMYLLQRYIDGWSERSLGRVPVVRQVDIPQLGAEDLIRFATLNGADSLDSQGRLGVVAEGALADLVLLDTSTYGEVDGDPFAHIVMCTSYRDIHSVWVGGECRFKEGQSVGVDMAEIRDRRKKSLARIAEVSDRQVQEVVQSHMSHKRRSQAGAWLKRAKF